MKFKIIFLVVIILFLVGCTTPFKKDQGPVILGPGGKGVVVSFTENMPPTDSLREDSVFYVEVSLANYGKYINGEIIVYDTLEGYGGIPSGGISESFSLESVEEINNIVIPGVSDPIIFGPFSYSSDETGIYKGLGTSIYAELFYDTYEVEINKQICLTKRNVDSGCRAKESFSTNSLGVEAQNAPVTIKSIDKRVTYGREDEVNLILDIYLANVGGGFIGNDDEILDMGINLIGADSSFRCEPNYISLKRFGEKKVICEASINLVQDYEDIPLNIFLNYPYRTNVFVAGGKKIPIEPKDSVK